MAASFTRTNRSVIFEDLCPREVEQIHLAETRFDRDDEYCLRLRKGSKRSRVESLSGFGPNPNFRGV